MQHQHHVQQQQHQQQLQQQQRLAAAKKKNKAAARRPAPPTRTRVMTAPTASTTRMRTEYAQVTQCDAKLTHLSQLFPDIDNPVIMNRHSTTEGRECKIRGNPKTTSGNGSSIGIVRAPILNQLWHK